MKDKLSNQAKKIEQGQAPLPSYTCLHVKSNVSAKVFQVCLVDNLIHFLSTLFNYAS